VIVVLFGGAKLPKLARSLGQAQTEFRRGQAEGATPETEAEHDPETGVPPQTDPPAATPTPDDDPPPGSTS
jgi:Sec-independent protein translocase protein TatA